MKQILQNLKSGETELVDIPTPQVLPGQLLIATRRSLISAGTERMLVEFGKANLLAKARSQPDRVRQVLDKIRTDGLLPTLETVFVRLGQPLPLGYRNAESMGIYVFEPQSVKLNGLFDPITVQKLLQSDREGRVDAAYPIFAMICIELWCQIFLG